MRKPKYKFPGGRTSELFINKPDAISQIFEYKDPYEDMAPMMKKLIMQRRDPGDWQYEINNKFPSHLYNYMQKNVKEVMGNDYKIFNLKDNEFDMFIISNKGVYAHTEALYHITKEDADNYRFDSPVITMEFSEDFSEYWFEIS